MGLADRFKEKLQEKDIFNETKSEQISNTKNIQFISKPQKVRCAEILPTSDISTDSSLSAQTLNELKNEIIAKINKTPYWNEYSSQRKENMVGKYFETRLKKSSYSNIKYTLSKKLDFIQNIITLTNHYKKGT